MGRLITLTQAAAMVGVAAKTLSDWNRKSPGYFCRRLWVGNTICYDEDAVTEWLKAENRTAPRAACGEGHWRSKWPNEFIAQVIRLSTDGVSQRDISARLGMPRRTVRDIIAGTRRNTGVRGTKK